MHVVRCERGLLDRIIGLGEVSRKQERLDLGTIVELELGNRVGFDVRFHSVSLDSTNFSSKGKAGSGILP